MMDDALEARLVALELMQEKIGTAILQVGSLGFLAALTATEQDAVEFEKKHNEILRQVERISTSLQFPKSTTAAMAKDGARLECAPQRTMADLPSMHINSAAYDGTVLQTLTEALKQANLNPVDNPNIADLNSKIRFLDGEILSSQAEITSLEVRLSQLESRLLSSDFPSDHPASRREL